MSPSETLVVTLHMDDQSADYFTALRNAYFPSEINYLSAHISLFHNLPAAGLNRFRADIELCRSVGNSLLVNVTGVRFLGRGVAYTLQSAELYTLRHCLADLWQSYLTAQDRQLFQPHIIVQNKVPPHEARGLHGELTAAFRPRVITGTGVDFWYYRGGPWEHAAFVQL